MRWLSFANVPSMFLLASSIGCGPGDAPHAAARGGSAGSGTGDAGSSAAGASGAAGTGATGHGGQAGGVAGSGGGAGSTGTAGAAGRSDGSAGYKAYDDLIANYCVDTRRVFATGHSSGAQLIVQIMTHADAAKHMGFRAVAPVAASDYGVVVAPIPVIYIQGKMDSVRNSDGHETMARFTKANNCGATTMPYSNVMTCASSGATVNPGCVSYQSCAAPTVWCSHDDPAYSNTSHGWPCFATKAMYDFFASVP